MRFVEDVVPPRDWHLVASTWDNLAVYSKTCLSSGLLYSRANVGATLIWIKSKTLGYSWAAATGTF